MLVMLPPSEGKAGGVRGAALELGALALPGLRGAREGVLGALVALCEGDEGKARETLGLSEGLRGEVARNAGLLRAPARAAGQVYTGVLYDALDLASLSAAAKRRAGAQLLIFSGLWGAVRVGDRIPAYRCSMGVSLPGIGALGAYWRAAMADVLPEVAGEGLVLDLRSSAYAAAWKPQGEVAGRTATVRVLHARVVDGVERRSVVSHFNKATKGRIVRALLSEGIRPRGPGELVEALRELGYVVEARPPAKAGQPWQLDVVVAEL
ncbi:peroxide stress protein YaaA [Streptomyces polyrhachis]|uniref:Peroxide stress protein YaaA n=1 Tax=Streptomyces polyrhachis TaxID=1282885 RepID=A0ABW2GMB7_9ACTN